eukprot:1362948-Alexandrium_andersonii.AAC.1
MDSMGNSTITDIEIDTELSKELARSPGSSPGSIAVLSEPSPDLSEGHPELSRALESFSKLSGTL